MRRAEPGLIPKWGCAGSAHTGQHPSGNAEHRAPSVRQRKVREAKQGGNRDYRGGFTTGGVEWCSQCSASAVRGSAPAHPHSPSHADPSCSSVTQFLPSHTPQYKIQNYWLQPTHPASLIHCWAGKQLWEQAAPREGRGAAQGVTALKELLVPLFASE